MTSEQAAAVADAERLVCELREVGARLLADLPEGDDGQVRAELRIGVFANPVGRDRAQKRQWLAG